MAKSKDAALEQVRKLMKENPGVACRALWASLNPFTEEEFREAFNKVANETEQPVNGNP